MMVVRASIALLLVLIGASVCRAKQWRGIVPLHSNRSDVERLLGRPVDPEKEFSASYKLPMERVLIFYANGRACGVGASYSSWRVPAQTVIDITVVPNVKPRLTELSIDENSYRRIVDPHIGRSVLVNDVEGHSVYLTNTNYADYMMYYAAASDANLRCAPASTQGTAAKGHTFDTYHDIPFEDEKSRLDNFAIQLMRVRDSKGYIITYAGRVAHKAEAQARLTRARDYLVKCRHIDPNRLVTIDGGYRERFEVELYIGVSGESPPTPQPTVDPRDVQIIK